MSADYDQAIEEVASWLERCCRISSLYDRSEIAAQLRLGAWRDMEPRRTAARDVAPARAHAEEWVQKDAERKARAKSAREAVASGAEPMYDYYGHPVGEAMKSFTIVAGALGLRDGGDARVFAHGADGITTVRDGNGKIVEQYPIHRRRNTRLAGHALAARVACLHCPKGSKLHPACECGEWSPDRYRKLCLPVSKAEERRWHSAHKSEVRAHLDAVADGSVTPISRVSS